MINLALAKEHALAGKRKVDALLETSTKYEGVSPEACYVTTPDIAELADHFAAILSHITGPTPESEATLNQIGAKEQSNGNSHRLSRCSGLTRAESRS